MGEQEKLAPVVRQYMGKENEVGVALPVGQLFWKILEELNRENLQQGIKKPENLYHIPDFTESLLSLEGYYFPNMACTTEIELQIDLALASAVEYLKRETGEDRYQLDFSGRLVALQFYIAVLQALPEQLPNRAGIKWKFIGELCNLGEQIEPSQQFLVAAEGTAAE